MVSYELGETSSLYGVSFRIQIMQQNKDKFIVLTSRTNVYFSIDNEHSFCYIIEKNKCFERGVDLMTRRYKVANRFRFTVFVTIMIILITTVMNFALGLNTADSLTYVEYMDLEIMSGDTLWTIAETYMTDFDDIRMAVHELCQINDISADQLYAGMTIQVPVTA